MPRNLDAVLQESPAERGRQLATLPEDQWFERKSARVQAKDVAVALIGMANAEGGTVVIGLHGGAVEGVRRSGRRGNDWRQAPVDHVVPPVRATFSELAVVDDRGEQDEVLVVVVDPSDRVHATVRDEVYLRVGDETRRLTYAQRQELEFDKGQSTFEASPARSTARGDLDERALAVFAAALGHPDPERLLAARGLLARDGRLTIGAALLFAPDPQVEVPEASVRVLRHRGSARTAGRRQQIVHDARIEGPLPAQIESAQRVVAELLPTRRALNREGRFEDVGAIPRDAWLEGVVNAVTHRSYSVAGDHFRVEIFDDRLEIESPGRFPGTVDLHGLADITRYARNPRIARVLADLGFGQELGEGIRRMFEEMRLAGLDSPLYRQTAGSVRLTLSAEPVDREMEDRLPPAARSLVRMIREEDRPSTGDLTAATGRSRPTVLRDLRALEEAGVIERVGTSRKDPRAYWRLRGGAGG